ncbi:MAG: acyl-CoA thioesterase [Polyangiaceae bacterium]
MTDRPDDMPIFRQRMRVDGGDIDELGHASNISYVRWIQHVAMGHSRAVGWTHDRYLELGAVFVVRRHEIDYLRPAMANDELEVCTWVEGWRAATSVRRTRIVRPTDGEELARASTTWALVAVEGGRPTRIPAELRHAFAVGVARSAAEGSP